MISLCEENDVASSYTFMMQKPHENKFAQNTPSCPRFKLFSMWRSFLFFFVTHCMVAVSCTFFKHFNLIVCMLRVRNPQQDLLFSSSLRMPVIVPPHSHILLAFYDGVKQLNKQSFHVPSKINSERGRTCQTQVQQLEMK